MILRYPRGTAYICDYCQKALDNPANLDAKTELPRGWCEFNMLGVAIAPQQARHFKGEGVGELLPATWHTCSVACAEMVRRIISRLLPENVARAEIDEASEIARRTRGKGKP